MRSTVMTGSAPGRVIFAVVLVPLMMLLACGCAFALDPSLDLSQYAHTSWKVREGFAKGRVSWITQTPDGYLWLGTEFGLLRFDGVRAVPWQPPNGEQLPSNWIAPLLVAHDGTLWIGTLKGLASWKEGKLTQYREVAGTFILSIIEARDRTIWLAVSEASKGRLCAIRDGKVECYGEGMFGNAVIAIYQDHNGVLWATTQTGLWRWAPGPQKEYAFPHGVIEANSLIEDDAGALLLATNDGLKQFVNGKIENYPLPGISGQFRPSRLFRSSDGSLWISTDQGLLHLHNGRVDRFSTVEGLSSDSAGVTFEDREGNVWVGTTDGLDRFREYSIPTTSRKQGLPNSYVGLVQATPDGGVWIGSAQGLNRWANDRLTFYRGRSALGENRSAGETKIGGVGTEIANSGLVGTTLSLGLDDAKRLWVSTSDGVFYSERNRFIRVPGIPGYALSIAGDGHGKVWTLHNKEGVFCWSPTAPTRHISWSQFAQKMPRTMLPDREPDGLWLGFFNGGLVYLKDDAVVRAYGAADGLGGRVNHLRFGPNGGLWVSTEGGLSRIKDAHVSTMTQKNGLPCDEVHWSVEDDDHGIWLYMPCGLVRIVRSELDAWINDATHVLKTTVFDNSDGVKSVGIYGNYGPRVTKSPDGRIWFIPGDGVSVIDPRHLPFNKLPPPVHIEQVVENHKAYLLTSDASGNLRLPPLIRDLQIDYTALSLVAPEKVLFRYKLEGWDRDWQEAGTRRQAFYANLPPRNYRFRVMACNNSGVWNEVGASLEFFVAPAYYQTSWFRSLCAIAFLGLLVAGYQLRMHQVNQQFNMRLEGRVAERTRIARDLHDTLLQSFQGVLLKFHAVGYMIRERPEEAEKTLQAAIDQARQAITEGRDAVQGLRSSALVGNELARAIRILGDELTNRQKENHCPDLRVQVEGTVRDLAPIIRDDVYRIAGEAVRNSFLHAQATEIEVEIRYDERHLRVRIRDNGRGIDPKILQAGAREGHYGLPGMHERARAVGGKLAVWSELDFGTEMELTIPAAIAYAKSTIARRAMLWKKGA